MMAADLCHSNQGQRSDGWSRTEQRFLNCYAAAMDCHELRHHRLPGAGTRVHGVGRTSKFAVSVTQEVGFGSGEVDGRSADR